MNTNSRPTAELINIIKQLFYNTSGENTQERDNIIKRVDSQYNECDGRIDKYIRESSKDLSRLIKVFNDIASKIEASRSNVSHSREALKQCKILLQSKRDEVRRLWLEWCEQKCYYNNLAKLRQIYLASENVRIYCTDKNYIQAAELIADCTRMIQFDFRDISGLNDIKRIIDDERIKLEKNLLEELVYQLYTSVTKSVLETGSIQPVREASFRRRFRHHKNDDSGEINLQGQGQKAISSEAMIEKIVQAASKLNNSESNINILEQMISDINKTIVANLIQIINSTSSHVVESNLIDNSKLNRQSIENNPKFLCQLIDLAFEQFKIAARLYKYFIECTNKVIGKKSYQAGLIWTCIQNVLVKLLQEYLDIKKLGQNSQNNGDMLENIDINSFFSRKRLLNIPFTTDSAPMTSNPANPSSSFPGDGSQNRMFQFKNSSHAMSINNYIREKNNEDLFTNMNSDSNNKTSSSSNQRDFKILVCLPDHRNITSIFTVMEQVIKEVAEEIRTLPVTNGDSGQQVTNQKPDYVLDKFIQEFILNIFIANAVKSINQNARINSIIDGKIEISKELIPLQLQKELGLNKPILQNILHVYQSCHDLFSLIKDMGSYALEFTRAMSSLIDKHIKYCNDLYISIVSFEDDFVFSNSWVQDETIKQFYKQLPSFSSAIKNKASPAAILSGARNTNLGTLNNMAISTATTNLNSQNPAVLKAQVEVDQYEVDVFSNDRLDTLLNNLCDKELQEVNIITNFNHIEMIAHLHESCDWLIIKLKQIFNSLEQMAKNPTSLNHSLSMEELNKLTRQLSELDRWRCDTLLLLYIETRVHCFFHLISFIKQENITSYAGDVDTDPDQSVLNMNRDLHRIYEHLSRSLQEPKLNYVFDALGAMIATIFIRAVKNFKKISTHGIAKMCRNIFNVEQNLSAMRAKADPHLMRAHRFYELLYKKPEELLNHLIDHEAEFQSNDYVNVLNLIYRSQPGNEINSLSDNIQALKNILQNKH